MRSTDGTYGAMRCAVLTGRMVLAAASGYSGQSINLSGHSAPSAGLSGYYLSPYHATLPLGDVRYRKV
eukprot:1182712-Rhodomonas_salina.3